MLPFDLNLDAAEIGDLVLITAEGGEVYLAEIRGIEELNLTIKPLTGKRSQRSHDSEAYTFIWRNSRGHKLEVLPKGISADQLEAIKDLLSD